MQYLYIDESGSMTKEYAKSNPNFVMCVVRVKDEKNLRKILKRFIMLHYDEINKADKRNKIFKNGSFIELKGSSLTKELKIKLANFLCQKELLELYYIFIDNDKVKDGIFDEPSLVYNYVLCLLLEKHLKNMNLPFDDYLIDIDQRNLKKISINSLEEYLNIELKIRQNLLQSLNVEYYDSKDNLLVQVSDFFSNLYFSYLRFPQEYKQLFNKLKDNNYIKDIYYYPQSKHK